MYIRRCYDRNLWEKAAILFPDESVVNWIKKRGIDYPGARELDRVIKEKKREFHQFVSVENFIWRCWWQYRKGIRYRTVKDWAKNGELS